MSETQTETNARRSASQRASESRAAKLAAGYVAKTFLLPPEAAADLATLAARDGVPELEAVGRALATAAWSVEPEAAPVQAIDSPAVHVSPPWFIPEGWVHTESPAGWWCYGRCSPAVAAADVRAMKGDTLRIGPEHWPVRGVQTSEVSDGCLVSEVCLLIAGAPPADAEILEGPK